MPDSIWEWLRSPWVTGLGDWTLATILAVPLELFLFVLVVSVFAEIFQELLDDVARALTWFFSIPADTSLVFKRLLEARRWGFFVILLGFVVLAFGLCLFATGDVWPLWTAGAYLVIGQIFHGAALQLRYGADNAAADE